MSLKSETPSLASGLLLNASVLSDITGTTEASNQIRDSLIDTSKVTPAKGGESTSGSHKQMGTDGSQSGNGGVSNQNFAGNQGGSNTAGDGSASGNGQTQPHGTSPATSTKPKYKFYPADASYNIRTGRASIREVYPGCNVVGWVGMESSTLTFTNIDGGATGGTKEVQIHYICAGGSRDAYLSVNGGPAKKVTLPSSGKKWDDFGFDFKVALDGFVPGRKNTVTVSHPDGWTADIWRIGIQQ